MALEPSEIFTAASCCFHYSLLEKAQRNVPSLLMHFVEAEKVAASGEVVFAENRNQFLAFFRDPLDNPGNVVDMLRGVSAAIAIQKWIKYTYKVQNAVAHRVYMTGNVWPDKVKPLAIAHKGFTAYNSSDLIINPASQINGYYGVSLKKKPRPDDGDPTLINKAFDTVLNDKQFDDIKMEVERERVKYFAGLVRDAVKEGHIKIDGINNMSDADLFKPSPAERERQGFARKRIFIDTKGSLKMPEIGEDPFNPVEGDAWLGYGDTKLNRSALASRNDTMRAWVNRQLGKPDCPLYKKLLKVMNDHSDTFSSQLINLTLKTDLPRLMKEKNLGKMKFGFALVTGIGTATRGKKLWEEKGALQKYSGKAIDINTILKGLAELDSADTKYNFVVTNRMEAEPNMDEGGAAKVLFDLRKGNIPVMNMELRYKGGFGSQPQFFGTLSNEFKQMLKGQRKI